MMDCMTVLDAQKASGNHILRWLISIRQQDTRYEHFLERHNLLEKLFDEDVEGLR